MGGQRGRSRYDTPPSRPGRPQGSPHPHQLKKQVPSTTKGGDKPPPLLWDGLAGRSLVWERRPRRVPWGGGQDATRLKLVPMGDRKGRPYPTTRMPTPDLWWNRLLLCLLTNEVTASRMPVT